MEQKRDCILVGHSSGCAIANAVASASLRNRYERFRLIALDGFCPNPELLELPGTEVWSAKCGDVYSLNYEGLQVKAGKNFRVYEANVRKRWPLHFSLVNVNVTDERDQIEDGYWVCKANMHVLGMAEDPTYGV